MLRRAPPWVRLLVVLALLALLALGARAMGLTDSLDKEGIRTLVQDAGALGMVAFFLLVVAGSLVQVPGLLFLAVAGLVWGPVQGALVAYPSLLCAQAAVFTLTRVVGGSPLGSMQGKYARRVLAHVEERPIRTVALARLLFWLHPSYALFMALSSIRPRDYMTGEVLGLIVPCVVSTVAFGLLLAG